MGLSIRDILALSPEDQIRAVEAGDISDAIIHTLPLDTAFNNFCVEISGNFFCCIFGTDNNTNADIQFNKVEPNNQNAINFTQGLQTTRPFARFFVTSAAQAGKTIKFLIATSFPLFGITDNRSEVTQGSSLATIATNTENTTDNTRSLNGDTGTQIAKNGSATGVALTTIHAVTAGKNLYLTAASLTAYGANGFVRLIVTDAADAEQYNILFAYPATQAGSQSASTISFSRPLKIAAGFKLKVDSVDVLSRGNAGIFGWEE